MSKVRWCSVRNWLAGKRIEDIADKYVIELQVGPDQTAIVEESKSEVHTTALVNERVFAHTHRGWKKGRYVIEVSGDAGMRSDGEVHLEPIAHEEILFRTELRPNDPLRDIGSGLLGTLDEFMKRRRFTKEHYRELVPISALVRAKVNPYVHQVRSIRTVLADPVQRYILADEVGLGKTIEAGLILLQNSLDGLKSFLVVVPDPLVGQWRAEMGLRFGLKEQVEIVGFEEVRAGLQERKYDALVIDEAHQVAAGRHGQDAALYDACAQLSLTTPRVLLLSATPALRNEADLLALLHLLEPGSYDLSSLDTFREKVHLRRELGIAVNSLREAEGGAEVRELLEAIEALLPSDPVIDEQIGHIRTLSREKPLPQESMEAAIGDFRFTVSDRFRIDSRLLRASRTEATKALQFGRHNPDSKAAPEPTYSEGQEAIFAALDDWRRAARAPASVELAYGRILCLFVTAASTWAGYLRELLWARLGASREDLINARDLALLREAPEFEGEEALLRQLIKLTEDYDCEEGDGLDVAADVLLRWARSQARIVVFATEGFVLEALAGRLASKKSKLATRLHLAGMPNELNVASVEEVLYEAAPAALLTDQSGEEGLNLQIATHALMLDLPWSPERIEQRLGRIDRLGRRVPMQVRAVIGGDDDDSLSAAWFTALDKGFGIFRESTAALQEFVPGQMDSLFRAAMYGARAVLKQVPRLAESTQQERRKIRNEQALDEERIDARAERMVETLEKLQRRHDARQVAFETWTSLAYGISAKQPSQLYPNYRVWNNGRTPYCLLARLWPLLRPSPSTNARGRDFSGTFCRDRVVARPGTDFIGPGHPAYDLIVEDTLRTDFGRTAGVRRKAPTPETPAGLYFVLDILLTSGTPLTEGELDATQTAVFRRLSQAWFSRQRIRLSFNYRGNLVTDPVVRMAIEADPGQHDTGMTHRALRQAILPELLLEGAESLRVNLAEIVLGSTAVQEWIHAGRQSAAEELGHRALRLHASDPEVQQHPTIRAAAAFPQIFVDSVLMVSLVHGDLR